MLICICVQRDAYLLLTTTEVFPQHYLAAVENQPAGCAVAHVEGGEPPCTTLSPASPQFVLSCHRAFRCGRGCSFFLQSWRSIQNRDSDCKRTLLAMCLLEHAAGLVGGIISVECCMSNTLGLDS